jgi:hypothetical protein
MRRVIVIAAAVDFQSLESDSKVRNLTVENGILRCSSECKNKLFCYQNKSC